MSATGFLMRKATARHAQGSSAQLPAAMTSPQNWPKGTSSKASAFLMRID